MNPKKIGTGGGYQKMSGRESGGGASLLGEDGLSWLGVAELGPQRVVDSLLSKDFGGSSPSLRILFCLPLVTMLLPSFHEVKCLQGLLEPKKILIEKMGYQGEHLISLAEVPPTHLALQQG